MTPWLQAVLAALLLSLSQLAQAQVMPSRDASGITDMTSTFTPDQRQALSAQLKHLQRRTGAEVLVLSVNSLQGEAPEAFSQRIFELWKPGGAKRQDGVLVVLAHRERTLRLHVGPGLASAVPSHLAKEITSTVMAPRLKRGDFYLAMAEGAQALEGHILVQTARAGRHAPPEDSDTASKPLALRMDTDLRSVPKAQQSLESVSTTADASPAPSENGTSRMAALALSPTALASWATAFILCAAAGVAAWRRKQMRVAAPVEGEAAR